MEDSERYKELYGASISKIRVLALHFLAARNQHHLTVPQYL